MYITVAVADRIFSFENIFNYQKKKLSNEIRSLCIIKYRTLYFTQKIDLDVKDWFFVNAILTKILGVELI